MNVLKVLKGIFEKNGLLKLLAGFIILIASVVLLRHYPNSRFFEITGFISLIWVVIFVITFLIAGIVNTIKDFKKK